MGGPEGEVQHPFRDRIRNSLSKTKSIAVGVCTYIPHALEFRDREAEQRQDEVVRSLVSQETQISWDHEADTDISGLMEQWQEQNINEK
jgi:hypothetical protein